MLHLVLRNNYGVWVILIMVWLFLFGLKHQVLAATVRPAWSAVCGRLAQGNQRRRTSFTRLGRRLGRRRVRAYTYVFVPMDCAYGEVHNTYTIAPNPLHTPVSWRPTVKQ